MDLAQLESEALSLPVEARASLAQRLLLSLEDISDDEFSDLWGVESARRLDASGHDVPADDVLRKARALLR